MRLELNIFLFVVFFVGALLFGYLYKTRKGGQVYPKIFFILLCSLLFPAFTPAHGEIIVALPNGALFSKISSLTWGGLSSY